MGQPSGTADRFEAALNHAWAVYELYANQRHSVVNYHLITTAFLTNAFILAINHGRVTLAVTVCLMGMATSFGAILNDLRLNVIMTATEKPIKDLQAQLASATSLDSLKIMEAAKYPRSHWRKRGVMARNFYGMIGVSFCIGAIYAIISRGWIYS